MGTHTIARRSLGALSVAAVIAAGMTQPSAATADPVAAAEPTTETFSTADSPQPIADSLEVGTPGAAAKQTVTVTGAQPRLTHLAVALTWNHTLVNDLVATVETPNGQVADLTFRPFTNNSVDGTFTFTDSATQQFGTPGSPPGPRAPASPGSYRATSSGDTLVALDQTFAGVNPNGTWTITIVDNAPGDVGTLTDSSLTISADAAADACAEAQEALTAAKARVVTAKEKLREARKSGNQRRIEKAKKRLEVARDKRADAQNAVDQNCRPPRQN